MTWISCIKRTNSYRSIKHCIKTPPEYAFREEKPRRVQEQDENMRRKQRVTGWNMCMYESLCICVPVICMFECFRMFVSTHPVPTAPVATQTRQNKASSDSSVSGTAVGPR